jgi:hypothetical protein
MVQPVVSNKIHIFLSSERAYHTSSVRMSGCLFVKKNFQALKGRFIIDYKKLDKQWKKNLATPTFLE